MNKFLLFILTFCISFCAIGQKKKMIVYDFNNTLSDTSNQRVPLAEIEKLGYFSTDTIKEIGGIPKKVYNFGLNSGLAFDNTESGNPIREGFSIELYFKLDMYNAWKRVLDFKNKVTETGPYIYLRKVSFYKYGSADMKPILPGTYVHYIITRDSATAITKISINGEEIFQFKDSLKLATLDKYNYLNLFHDNMSMGNEASAGKIALLKIYDHVIDKNKIKENYNNLASDFRKLNKRLPPPPPPPEIVIRGNIIDKRNGAPAKAKIIFERTSDNGLVKSIDNNVGTGDYSLKLRAGQSYIITATAKGFNSYTETIDLKDVDPKQIITKDIELSRMEVGKAITLNRIIFKQGGAEMYAASYDELDKLIDLMIENPNMEIELSGHTDNQGNAKLNIKLSEDRVKAVKDYLIKTGAIDSRRISGRGYGGAKPIASNVGENTRKLNRRVEFTIKKYW